MRRCSVRRYTRVIRPGRPSHCQELCRLLDEFVEGGRQCFGVTGRHEPAGNAVVDHLGDPAHARPYDRNAMGVRLEDHCRQRVMPDRGHAQDVYLTEELRGVHSACKADVSQRAASLETLHVGVFSGAGNGQGESIGRKLLHRRKKGSQSLDLDKLAEVTDPEGPGGDAVQSSRDDRRPRGRKVITVVDDQPVRGIREDPCAGACRGRTGLLQ